MPIRFLPDGSFEFDTVEEAVEWRKRLAADTGPTLRQQSAPPAEAPSGRAARGAAGSKGKAPGAKGFNFPPQSLGSSVQGFIQMLNKNGRKVVKALADAHPGELSTEDLARAIDLAATKLGPVFRHIYKAADRAGLPEGKGIIRQDLTGAEGKSQSSYGVSQEVAEAMKRRA